MEGMALHYAKELKRCHESTVMAFSEVALALAGSSGPSHRFRLADDALLVAIEPPVQAGQISIVSRQPTSENSALHRGLRKTLQW